METQGSRSSPSHGQPPTKPHCQYPETQSTSTEKDIGGCLRGRPLQVASVLAANVIAFCFGYGGAFPSATLTELETFYTEEQISWIISGPLVALFVGAATWSQIVPRIGPKNGTLVTGIPMLVGWCLHLNLGKYWFLLSGRLLSGLAAGGMLASVPHYATEIAEDSLRGTLGSILTIVINIGALFAYGLGAFINAFHMALVCAFIPVIFMVIFFPCPESPIYLLNNQRADQGRRNLERLRYPRDVSHELASIPSGSGGEKVGWGDLFRERASRKAVAISLAMFTFQQSSGIIPLVSYQTDIFRRAGGSVDPITGSCIVASVQIVGSVIGMTLIERFGRRVLMMSSCLGMVITHGLMGYALMPGSNTPGWLPVTCLSVFLLAYTMGAANVPIVIANELATASLRSKMATVGIIYMGVVVFITVKTYSDLVRLIGIHGLFWTYATGCAAGIVFTFFFLPETAGRSSASIQEELNGKRGKQLTQKLPK